MLNKDAEKISMQDEGLGERFLGGWGFFFNVVT